MAVAIRGERASLWWMVFRTYLLLKHYLPKAHIRFRTRWYHKMRPLWAHIMYARLWQIINMLPKPFSKSPGSGLHRPITTEHLLYRASVVKKLSDHFWSNLTRRRAASCLLQWLSLLEWVWNGSPRLYQINPFFCDSFSGSTVKPACFCSSVSPGVFFFLFCQI